MSKKNDSPDQVKASPANHLLALQFYGIAGENVEPVNV